MGEAYCGIFKSMSICIQMAKFAYISSGSSNFDQALLTGLQSTGVRDTDSDRRT